MHGPTNFGSESLQNSREVPLCRLNHFLQLIGEDEIKITSPKNYTPIAYTIEKPTGDLKVMHSEILETTLSHVAAGLQSGATALAGSSELIPIIPTPQEQIAPMGVGVAVKFGPKNIAEGVRGAAILMEVCAQVNKHLSDSAARINSFTRQYQDRVLQANSAGHELNSINDQIKTQEIRVIIVEKDIQLQEEQLESAKATEESLRKKYTNEALYSWRETQLRTLHYQTYIVAYDLAKKVEKSYQFERGLTGTDNFIGGGWDDCRDGLLSAEALGLGLRRLEAAYQEKRGHDFEITKHISLRQIKPKALLKLRATNSCTFSLSQILFDVDFPGHHMRRLKSVSLSLPCVDGPYTSVNSTLELVEHSYQLTATGNSTKKEVHYVPIHSVAFSSGQNDPGVFELNFHDERYLPFEGAGAISTWNLSLPKFRAFYYDTISDVIMHLRYTSIAGVNNASQSMDKRGGKGDELYASFDLRNEFASGWQQLVSGGDMVLSDLNEPLPWWTTKYDMTVLSIHLLTSTTTNQFTASTEDEFVFRIKSNTGEAKGTKSGASIDGMMSFAIDNGIAKFGTWGLMMATQTFALADLWMVVQYTAQVK